jgi:uncharacterized protein YeeX (DUF496 family)
MLVEKELEEVDSNVENVRNRSMILQNYVSFVEMSYIRYWPVYIDMDDSLLVDAFLPLVQKGDFTTIQSHHEFNHRARQIEILRKRQTKPISSELQEIFDRVEVSRNLAAAIDDDDVTIVEGIVSEYLPRYTKQQDLIDASYWLWLKRCSSPDEYIDFMDSIKKQISIHPNDGKLIKYLGDALLNVGYLESSLSMYATADRLTNDGMVRLDIEKKEDMIRSLLVEPDEFEFDMNSKIKLSGFETSDAESKCIFGRQQDTEVQNLRDAMNEDFSIHQIKEIVNNNLEDYDDIEDTDTFLNSDENESVPNDEGEVSD